MYDKFIDYADLPIFTNFLFNEENVQNSVHNVKNFDFQGFFCIFLRGEPVKNFPLQAHRVL